MLVNAQVNLCKMCICLLVKQTLSLIHFILGGKTAKTNRHTCSLEVPHEFIAAIALSGSQRLKADIGLRRMSQYVVNSMQTIPGLPNFLQSLPPPLNLHTKAPANLCSVPKRNFPSCKIKPTQKWKNLEFSFSEW